MTAGLIAIRPPFRRHSPLGEAIHGARKALFSLCPQAAPPQQPTGNVYQVHGAELLMTADDNHGAAIYSLAWNGVEFVNSADRGREIQTAYQLDGLGEQCNPTECGQEGALTQPCATKVLSAAVNGKLFTSKVYPAYWYAFQGQATSPDTISKIVTVDYNGVSNLIRHDVSIVVAQNHNTAALASLCGYLNSQFSVLYYFNPADGSFTRQPPPPAGGGNPQNSPATQFPIVMASPDGSVAMAVFSKSGVYVALMNAFGSGSNNWNAAWQSLTPFPAGTYKATVYYIVGTLADVQTKLKALVATA